MAKWPDTSTPTPLQVELGGTNKKNGSLASYVSDLDVYVLYGQWCVNSSCLFRHSLCALKDAVTCALTCVRSYIILKNVNVVVARVLLKDGVVGASSDAIIDADNGSAIAVDRQD